MKKADCSLQSNLLKDCHITCWLRWPSLINYYTKRDIDFDRFSYFWRLMLRTRFFFVVVVVWFQAECSMWRLIITDKIFLCKNLDLVETGSWGFKWTSKNKQHRETQMTAMDKPSWVTIMLIKESFTLMKESWVTHFSVLEVFET